MPIASCGLWLKEASQGVGAACGAGVTPVWEGLPFTHSVTPFRACRGHWPGLWCRLGVKDHEVECSTLLILQHTLPINMQVGR